MPTFAELTVMAGALLLAAPAFGVLYARAGRADGRAAAGTGLAALVAVGIGIALERLHPPPRGLFELALFSATDLALIYAALGSNVVGGAVVVLGLFGIAPSGSHGRRLVAAWILLWLPVLVSALVLGVGLLWLGVLPTLALGLVTVLAPKPPKP